MGRLGLGCSKLGSFGAGAGMRESVALVRTALERGVSYFDTADAYGAGSSEHVLGRALRGHRDEATIATKGGYVVAHRSRVERWARMVAARNLRRLSRARTVQAGAGNYAAQDFSPVHLSAALDASLRRLRTDHVDVYQLHGPRQLLPAACAWAEDAIAAGKIGRFGVGAEDLQQARTWAGITPVSVLQLPYGLLDPQAIDLIPLLHRDGVEVVARGVLGAGLLGDAPSADHPAHKQRLIAAVRGVAAASGCSAIQLALWYVLARPDVARVLVGASSITHLDEFVLASATPVDPAVAAALDDAIGAADDG